MKFTIVTISFNQAKYLERTICSVLEQDGVEIEYIVVDPGSTDGSRRIIERYSNDISRIVFENDSGPADGLNKGFSYASGEWFGYINSDDYYLPNAIKRAAEAASRFPEAGAIVGNGFFVNEAGDRQRKLISTHYGLDAALFGACFSLQQATFYRAGAFKDVGGFNDSNKTCWDGEILMDIASKGYSVKRFDAYVGAFRIHSASITGSGRLSALYAKDVEEIFKRIKGRDRSFVDRIFTGPIVRTVRRLSDPVRLITLGADRLLRLHVNRDPAQSL